MVRTRRLRAQVAPPATRTLYQDVVEFLITAAPLRARRQNSELFRRWVRNLKILCDAIVQQCIVCCMHGPAPRRKAGIGVVPVFEIGVLDLFVLDFNLRLSALAILDVGSGYVAFCVLHRQPPDGGAVYVPYVQRWASTFGTHRALLLV